MGQIFVSSNLRFFELIPISPVEGRRPLEARFSLRDGVLHPATARYTVNQPGPLDWLPPAGRGLSGRSSWFPLKRGLLEVQFNRYRPTWAV